MTDFEPPPNTPGRAEWVRTHISKLRARTALPPPERLSIGSWSWVPVEPLDIFAKPEALEATKPNDLKEFTLFSELPIELRKTIFEITIPDARTIEFSSYNVSIVNKESSYEDPNPSVSYVTPMHDGHIDVTKRHPTTSSAEATTMNLPWVLLAVNSESRVVAQHFYTLSVEKRLGRGIYIDFKRDFLLFTSAHALQTMGGMMKPFKHSNWGQNRVDELIERLPTKRNETEKYAQTIMLAGLLPKIKPLVVMLSRFQNLKEVHLVSERVRPGYICRHHAERINMEPFKKLWKELQDRDAEKTGILPSTRAFPDIVEWKEREFFREFTSKWIPERQGYSNDWKTFASTDEEFERYLEALDLS